MADALKIILGIIGTAVAFYFTSSMLLAQKQLIAATRLSGYLTYWQNWIIERDLFRIYYLGVKWNEEIREIVKRRGSAEEMVKLQQDKKTILRQVKEQLEKEGIDFDREKLVRDLQRRLPKNSVESLMEYSKTTRQNLIDGKTFISDEEAANLGVAFTHSAIELKMDIIDLLDSGMLVLVSLVTAPTDFDVTNFSTEISQMVWKSIMISKNIDLLARSARAISSKSVLALTLQNVRNGSRLTKL